MPAGIPHGAAALLPGLYVALLGVSLAALLRWRREPLSWRAALALLVLVLLVFAPVLFLGRVLLPLDSLRGYAPFRSLPAPAVHGNYLQHDLLVLVAPALAQVREAYAGGAWPLHDPLVGTGVPLLADPQAQALQPLVLLALPFPLATAAGVVAALRVLCALLFTFLFLRRLGASEGAALAGACAWGLGGFVLLWLGWPIANTGALLPPALWAAVAALDRGERGDLLAVLVATAALALCGQPEAALDAFALVGAFAVVRAWKWKRALVPWAAATGLGLLLAAPALVPGSLAASRSERAERLLARQEGGAHPIAVPGAGAREDPRHWEGSWGRLLRGRWVPLVAPFAFGNDRFLAYWGPENVNEDASGWVGSATLLLALLGGFAARSRTPREERLLQGAALAALLLLALPPALRPWLDRLPLALQSPSYHHRLLLVVGFSIACLAALAIARLERGELRRWPVVPLAVALAGLVVWATLTNGDPGQPDHLAVLRLGWLRWHLRFLAATAIVVVVAGRLRTTRATGAVTRWLGPAIAALVAAELLLAHAPANPPMPAALAFPPSAALVRLATHLRGAQRMAGVDGAIPPNVASLYGLADVRAYDPLAPASCAAALAPLAHLGAIDLGDPLLRAQLARLGVAAALLPPDVTPPAGLPVWRDAAATLVPLPSPRPLLYAEGSAGRVVPLDGLQLAPSRIGAVLPREAGGESEHRLGSSLCADGWRLLVDGSPGATAARPDGLLAAALPPDARRLELLHRPRGFLAGCLLASLAAATAVTWLLPAPRR